MVELHLQGNAQPNCPFLCFLVTTIMVAASVILLFSLFFANLANLPNLAKAFSLPKISHWRTYEVS